jgi:hypothetical protein
MHTAETIHGRAPMNAYQGYQEVSIHKDQAAATLEAEREVLKREVSELRGALQAATSQLITARRLYLDELAKTVH